MGFWQCSVADRDSRLPRRFAPLNDKRGRKECMPQCGSRWAERKVLHCESAVVCGFFIQHDKSLEIHLAIGVLRLRTLRVLRSGCRWERFNSFETYEL